MLTLEELKSQRIVNTSFPAPKFNYMGAGAKNQMLHDWLELHSSASKYIDLTAGSNNQPIAIAGTHHIPVCTNDGSYYSHCISKGALSRNHNQTPVDQIAKLLITALNRKYYGTFCKINPNSIPDEFMRFIDTLVILTKKIPSGHKEFVRACIGDAILKELSFRGSGFSWYLRKDTSIEKIAKLIYRIACRKNHYSFEGESYHGHVADFIREYDGFEDATVNIDPAWPFNDGSKNPYYFYIQLGAVLKQELPDRPFPFWADNNPREVSKEFRSWLSVCFDKKCKEVYVWNQTTNVPSRKMLIGCLKAKFKVEEVRDVIRKSTTSSKRFTDYILRVTK